jgi:hypothetical protein
MECPPTIDRLLNLVPDSPDAVLGYLRAHPDLASKQDAHGYSLVHAATSYNHLDLLQALVQEFAVDVNVKDEDGETCLFNAESVEFAKELVDLGVNVSAQNGDGQTAAEKLDDDDEQPEVAAYLKGLANEGTSDSAAGSSSTEMITNGDTTTAHPPPPLPDGVQVNIETMQEGDVGADPDPEFRRRIEELAARQDFDGSEGQQELKDLISVRPSS